MFSLQSPEVDELSTLLDEATRASAEGVARFVEPAPGTLRKALSKQHQMVFGRRGSGKSTLLRKAIAEFNLERQPSAYVDLESFKGHSYPDVLISVLIETFSSFKTWLDEAAVAPANRMSLWQKWFSSPRRQPLSRSTAGALSSEVAEALAELSHLLHAQDAATLERTLTNAASNTSEAHLGGGIRQGPVGLDAGIGRTDTTERSEVLLEHLRRSKSDFLHRKILDYQSLLERISALSEKDGLLILDDLYHIRRTDQPLVLDYFHRLAKGHRMWLKVGTIRHRSTWYRHGNPPVGMKLGDDAGEINLDVTLEKYSQAKTFLVQILGNLASEAGIPKTSDILTPGAIERLVLASGGVARDFLTILNRSIFIARERGHTFRGTKIGART